MDDESPSLPRRVAMRVWLAHVSAVRSRLVRPVDGRQAFAAGRQPTRVLLLGSGPVMGWGVSSHDLGLAGAVARSLAACTDRGAIVDVVPHPSAGVRVLKRMLASADVERYDALVLSGAVADAIRLAEPRAWGERLRRLLDDTRERGPRAVVWLGAQPIRSIRSYDSARGQIAQDHAERLNAVARTVCRETGTLFAPLTAPVRGEWGRHRSPADYLHWGRQVVDVLAPSLEEHSAAPRTAAAGTATAGSAADRVEAIERLKLSKRGGDARLEGIVGTAKRTLGTEIAMFTVLDDTQEWPLASTGSVLDAIPIEQSACIHTIQTPDGMVVPDAAEDGRFAANSLVTGPAGLRYYAGYPVEAPDGTRIGALCVFGRSPRESADGAADLDVLRELALLAQRELWRWTPEA